MIDYNNYIYNKECVFSKQNRKDRLEKQLGDFGEQLVMTLLGRIAKYSVVYVDHEGADLIATKNKGKEENEKGYAISVKSAQIGPVESESKVFEDEAQKKLCKFARDFDLIPAVAMLFIPRDFAFIDVYLITLDAFIKLAEDNSSDGAVKKVVHGLQINNFCLGTGKENKHTDPKGYLKYLQNNELIEHVRLDVRNRDNFSKGIRQVKENGSDDIKCIDRLLESVDSKDKNLPRQLGDAGEYLLMMLLGQQKGFKVARVDHVGADLIAADGKGKRYAISVKTNRNKSYEFYQKYKGKGELDKLKEFAEKYDMIPTVACIFIKNNFSRMDIYISSLDNWIKKSLKSLEDNSNAIRFKPWGIHEVTSEVIKNWTKTMSTFKISANTEKSREYLNNVQGIEHMEINFLSKLNSDVQWE